jgi:DNA gyrase inhibitor GyrI
MDEIDVRIVRLPRLRVASAHGFGPSPEEVAWDKLMTWAREKRLLDRKDVRFFGFNNPNPSPGSPNYGYEQWMTIEADIEASGDIKIKDFEGGLYAVTRCKLPSIGENWQALARWCDTSPYEHAHHQWLEEGLSPYPTPFEDVVMDIYLPIAE